MHVTTPPCFRINNGVTFDLPEYLRLQLGNPCICATMDGGVFSCFQDLSRSLWKACPVGLLLICNASSASHVLEQESSTRQYNLERTVMLLSYTNIVVLIGEIYKDNREEKN